MRGRASCSQSERDPLPLVFLSPIPLRAPAGRERHEDPRWISYLPITQRRNTTAVAAVTAMMSAQVAVIKNAIHAAAMRPTKNPTTLSTFMG